MLSVQEAQIQVKFLPINCPVIVKQFTIDWLLLERVEMFALMKQVKRRTTDLKVVIQ